MTREEVAKKTAQQLVDAMKLSLAKLDCLFEHFAIATTGNMTEDYRELSLRLAQEFVPGFQFVDADGARRGRPSRGPRDFISLLADFEVARRMLRQSRSRQSDSDVLAFLTTKSPFAKRWGQYRDKKRTLANILSKARDPRANPSYPLWQLDDPAGMEFRQILIDEYGITKKAH